MEIIKINSDYGNVIAQLQYVDKQRRLKQGVSPQPPPIWKRCWEKWSKLDNELKIGIISVIIAVFTLIAGCNFVTLDQIIKWFNTPAPALVSPANKMSFVKGRPITLKWNCDEEQEVVFEVRIGPKESKGWHVRARVREQYYIIPPDILIDSGAYQWQIAAIDTDTGKEYSSKTWCFTLENQ